MKTLGFIQVNVQTKLCDVAVFLLFVFSISRTRTIRDFLGLLFLFVIGSSVPSDSLDLSLEAGRECTAQEVSSELPILLFFLSSLNTKLRTLATKRHCKLVLLDFCF